MFNVSLLLNMTQMMTTTAIYVMPFWINIDYSIIVIPSSSNKRCEHCHIVSNLINISWTQANTLPTPRL